MPDYIHRTTLQQLYSIAPANLPEPESNYIREPDYSQVEGWPKYYWIINGDLVELADQSTRDAIDAQRLADKRDQISDQIDRAETILRAFAEVVLDEINLLRAEHPGFQPRTLSQLKTAIRNKLDG